MKTFVAALIATAFTISAVPAFACDGHKSADTSEGEGVMTAADGAEKDDVKKVKKKKEAKKEDKKDAKSEGEA